MDVKVIIIKRKVYFRIGRKRVYSIREGEDKNLLDAIINDNYYNLLGGCRIQSIPHICELVNIPDRYIQKILIPKFEKYEYVKKQYLAPADKALIFFGVMKIK